MKIARISSRIQVSNSAIIVDWMLYTSILKQPHKQISYTDKSVGHKKYREKILKQFEFRLQGTRDFLEMFYICSIINLEIIIP